MDKLIAQWSKVINKLEELETKATIDSLPKTANSCRIERIAIAKCRNQLVETIKKK